MQTCLSDLIRGSLFWREAGEKSAAQLSSIRPPGGGSRAGQRAAGIQQSWGGVKGRDVSS